MSVFTGLLSMFMSKELKQKINDGANELNSRSTRKEIDAKVKLTMEKYNREFEKEMGITSEERERNMDPKYWKEYLKTVDKDIEDAMSDISEESK